MTDDTEKFCNRIVDGRAYRFARRPTDGKIMVTCDGVLTNYWIFDTVTDADQAIALAEKHGRWLQAQEKKRG